VAAVEKKMPRAVKRKRRVVTEDGIDAGMEEYLVRLAGLGFQVLGFWVPPPSSAGRQRDVCQCMPPRTVQCWNPLQACRSLLGTVSEL
jgi:hypothetical protein